MYYNFVNFYDSYNCQLISQYRGIVIVDRFQSWNEQVRVVVVLYLVKISVLVMIVCSCRSVSNVYIVNVGYDIVRSIIEVRIVFLFIV